MPRDYAKYRAVKRSSQKKWRRAGSLLVAVLVLSLFAGSYGLYRYQKIWQMQWNDIFASLHRKKPSSVTVAPAKTEPEENVHFSFYTELPTMQVTPSTEDKPLLVKEVTEEPQEMGPKILQYVVQMGVFPDVNTASQSRLSLLLGGFESEIVKVTENGKNVYAVQQGPFPTLTEAKTAQKKLISKGVDSTIKKTL